MIIELNYNNYLADLTLITDPVKRDVEMSVVIPARNESALSHVLRSLSTCDGIERAEVIILINESEDDSEKVRQVNQQAYAQLLNHAESSAFAAMTIHPVYVRQIPAKRAGVGVARRIGMAEAARRLNSLPEGGIITCLDADCTVQPNYLMAQINAFRQYPELDAFSLDFEHDLTDNEAIRDYELHLRTYIEWQRVLELPWAFHTVGSSMAVRGRAYVAQGGMPNRKAGEDFYFLHKYSVINRLGVLNSTTVFPSGRTSDRVPFGTGRAIQQIQSGLHQMTYDHRSFLDLKTFTDVAHLLTQSNLPESVDEKVHNYLIETGFPGELEVIRQQTKTDDAFVKRLYQTFNPFRLMKYLHHMRDQYYPDVLVDGGCRQLLDHLQLPHSAMDTTELLDLLRSRQRQWLPTHQR